MEGLGEVGWEGVSGCEGVSGDVDGDGAVAACGGNQASDGPVGGGLQPAGHGKGCGDDGQVGLDGLAQVVVDGACSQVGLGHAEGLLDVVQAVVGADDCLGVGVGQVGDVALPPGQGAGPFLQVAVDAPGGAGQVHEAVALDGDLSCDGFLGLGDLGVDPA